ncbi:MAG: hypothetical protein IKK34_01650 [Clostridia bacterium]|nr:hypothetical protein [Clostridia bacterium]MBR3794720.1 hypothetical protein [Clostridia bacterium]
MSDKKLHTLTIDPEFRDLIPPLNDDELTMLEESIVANGCESPLIVWNGVIVDGHNRHAICQKHNIPFAVTEKEFSSREDAMLWMLRNQLGRRNLNSYQRGELALKFEPLIASASKKRMLAGKAIDPPQNSAEGSGETRHQIAKIAGVSHDTIKKVKKLSESADEKTKGKLRRGEVTVHKAYTELMQKEHENETRVCDRCKQEKPVAAFSIPSNRHGFSSLCKDCEKEISAAAKAAAEVASATTAKVETHPVNGMAMLNGAPIHVATPLPDEPDMLPHVMSTLETAAHSFLATVETSLRLMTRGIATPENLRIYEEALLSIADQAHELFKNHVKEIEKR